MSNPPLQQSLTPVREPQMADLLNLFKKNLLNELFCHHVGIIQTFNPENQTATVSFAYQKTVFTLNPQTFQYVPTAVNYTALIDVPVVFLGGFGAYLTFPVSPGDECLLLFNDVNIDNWFATSQFGQVASLRTHSSSDAIALVGIRSAQNTIDNFDVFRAALVNTDGTLLAKVGVGLTQVLIKNSINGALGPNFRAFFTALQTFMTACASSPDGTLAAAASAFNAAMLVPIAPSSVGAITNIGEILE